MENLTTRRYVNKGLLALAGSLLVGTRAANADSPDVPAQDISRPYQAWMLGIDTSKSLSPGQFLKSIRILADTVAHRVAANDLVWVVDAAAAVPDATVFPIPPIETRSEKNRWGADLTNAKERAIAAIRNCRQERNSTNLESPVRHALKVLAAHPNATSRLFVVASDFVTDLKGSGPSVAAPTPKPGVTASNVQVSLLIAHPTQNYLDELRMSSDAVSDAVGDSWIAYFSAMHALSVTAQPVDAVPTI
jgi:hypothetical protein